MNKIISFLTLIVISAINSQAQVKDVDNNTYKTVKIGAQIWMAENLNVNKFRNGDTIRQVRTADEWDKASSEAVPAWCYYGNDSAKGRKYGKLYNWYAVIDPRGLAPTGWHIPTYPEWIILTDFLGKDEASIKMKSTSGWENNKNGTNQSGFNALPSGQCAFGRCSGLGDTGIWWSSTEYNKNSAWFCYLQSYISNLTINYDFKNAGAFSVRCLKN